MSRFVDWGFTSFRLKSDSSKTRFSVYNETLWMHVIIKDSVEVVVQYIGIPLMGFMLNFHWGGSDMSSEH